MPTIDHHPTSRFPARVRTSGFLVAVAALSAALLPATATLAAPPAKKVFEYTFDAAPAGVVSDTTGKGHALTLNGAWESASGVTSGVNGGAVSFALPSFGNSPAKSDLNPGASEFAVTAVFRVGGNLAGLGDTPNIAQKGFFNDPGQWKMQLQPSTGSVQCRFRGSSGAALVTSPVTGIDDGGWHTAACWRTSSELGVTVDGVRTTSPGTVGSISTTRPLRVGGKSLSATSDQFVGSLDYLSFAVGAKAEAVGRKAAPS